MFFRCNDLLSFIFADNDVIKRLLTCYIKLCRVAKCDHLEHEASPRHHIQLDSAKVRRLSRVGSKQVNMNKNKFSWISHL